ncbi:MAG: hypothetical protein JWP97_804 [Labilithrix sp.]|nr:hypothetical protein [Labilithrix sp.]
MRLRALVGTVALLAFAACGGADHVHVTNDVAVTITPATDELPFDPRGARLRAATAQLTRIAGHPVAFEIDAAVASALRPDFERDLIDAVEQTARALSEWKAARGARSVAAFREVACRYVVTVEDDAPLVTFDSKTGVLRVELSAHPRALVPAGLVSRALAHEEDVYREVRYGDVLPEQVAPGERRAYFEALTHRSGLTERERATRERLRSLPPAEALGQSPEASVVLKVVRLDELSRGSDPALAALTRAWLFGGGGGVFRRAYDDRNVDVDAVPAGSAFRRAEAAYGAWLTRELPVATPAEQRKVIGSVFDARSPGAYPGLDRFALGLRVVDAWSKAGKPMSGMGARDDQRELFDEVVCPSVRDRRGKRVRNSGCTSSARGWLAYVADDERRLLQLARALDERDDPEVAATLLDELRGRPGRDAPDALDPFTTVLHALDPHKRSWRAAIEVLVENRRAGLREESAAIWKAHPDQRGTAVYVLARADVGYAGTNNEGSVWRGFAKSYGSPIDAPLLASMLDWGRPAFVEVPQVWPALAHGFSRADVLLPRLDALLPDATSDDAPEVLRALSAIVTRLCNDRSEADLAKLHAWTARRTASRPAERPVLMVLGRDTAPGGCGSRLKKKDD